MKLEDREMKNIIKSRKIIMLRACQHCLTQTKKGYVPKLFEELKGPATSLASQNKAANRGLPCGMDCGRSPTLTRGVDAVV